jgi:hypothetical protein
VVELWPLASSWPISDKLPIIPLFFYDHVNVSLTNPSSKALLHILLVTGNLACLGPNLFSVCAFFSFQFYKPGLKWRFSNR